MAHTLTAGARNFNKVLSASLFIFVLISGGSHADEYHYTNILIGDRASGMGGAYTAISDDATGLYYNPAGAAYAVGRNLSASVNAYYNLNKSYDSVIGGNGWDRKSSALLPNYFGILQPVGRFKVGFSYAVPDSNKEDQDQTFHNLNLSTSLANLNPGVNISSYTINFNNEDNTYEFGPSIATELTGKLSAGFTLYIHERRVQRILNQYIIFSNNNYSSNPSYEWSNSYYELNENGIKPLFGVMYSPADKLSLGLAVSKIIVMSSRGSRQDIYRLEGINYDTDNDGVADTTSVFGDSDVYKRDKREYPLHVSAGAAYFASSTTIFAADLNYYSSVSDSEFGDRSSVINLALGTEYFMTKSWALRAGVFTNMANTAEISAGKSGQPEHIDMYGGSLSISHFTRNTSVSLGGSLNLGTGEAQIVSGSTRIQNAESLGWALFLSSSYSY